MVAEQQQKNVTVLWILEMKYLFQLITDITCLFQLQRFQSNRQQSTLSVIKIGSQEGSPCYNYNPIFFSPKKFRHTGSPPITAGSHTGGVQ